MGLFIEQSLNVFLILTLVIGGGAAFMTGRAMALTWRPLWQLIVYTLLLGCALRFLHYALFQGELLSLRYYLSDTLVLFVAALLGFRLTRVKQMVTQYNWLYERSGPFGWRDKRS